MIAHGMVGVDIGHNCDVGLDQHSETLELSKR